MEDLLTCTICFELFDMKEKVPLSLICGHTFCRYCLSIMNPINKGIACPLDSNIDSRDLSSIPKNYSLIEIITLASSNKQLINPKPSVVAGQILDNLNQKLSDLEKAKSYSEQCKEESIQALTSSFNSLREILNYRESDLIGEITSTHTIINEKLNQATNSLNLLKSQEKVSNLIIPDISEILRVTSKLPIKVLISQEKIENSIESYTKIIDDTQSKTSNLKVIFVCDVRVKDGARFLPNSTFVKTWRIKNDGEETWPNGCWCTFSHGEFSGDNVVVDPAWPGEEIDVSVLLVAPGHVGTFKSFWKLVDPYGSTFGPILCAEIEVYNVN